MGDKDNHHASVSLPTGWWSFVTECLKEKITYIDNLKQDDMDDDSYADFKDDAPVYKIILDKIETSVADKLSSIQDGLNKRS